MLFVPDRCVPERKVCDDASLGRAVFWTRRPWDDASLRRCVTDRSFLKHWDRLSLCCVRLGEEYPFAVHVPVLRIRIRNPVPFWPLDPGSRIPIPYFWGLGDNFLGKNFNNSWKIGPNFFLQHIKNEIIFSLVKFVATKNGFTKKKFSPLSFVAVFGSGIRDG